jgi:hypothetical protein
MFTGMGFEVYFFFASLMLCSIIFIWFLTPETKGIPFKSMDRLFSKELVSQRAQKIVMQEFAEGEESFRSNVEGSGLGFGKDEFEETKGHVEVV